MSAFSRRVDMTPMGYRIASRLNADVMDTFTRYECESVWHPVVSPPENVTKISRLQATKNELVPPVGLEPTLP